MEVLLDDVLAVAQRDFELVESGAGRDMKEVPEQRLASDLDHGFRAGDSLLGEPCPKPPAKIATFIVSCVGYHRGRLKTHAR